jgi:outer membrane protein
MPEIQSADLSVEGSEYGVKSAKGQRYPSLFIRGNAFSNYSDRITERTVIVPENFTTTQIGFVPFQGNQIPVLTNVPVTTQEPFGFSEQMNENFSQSLTVGVTVPIFNRGQFTSQIQRAEITQDRAELAKQDRSYLLWQQIQQAYNDVEAASKSYNASLLAVRAREESFRVISSQFNNGGTNFVDYQVAENNYYQAQNDLVRAKYDLIFKQKILDFYQGKPLDF